MQVMSPLEGGKGNSVAKPGVQIWANASHLYLAQLCKGFLALRSDDTELANEFLVMFLRESNRTRTRLPARHTAQVKNCTWERSQWHGGWVALGR